MTTQSNAVWPNTVATQFLDADGAHAASQCPSSYAGRMQKHNTLARVVANAAKEAGLRVSLEPDTHSLLLGEFSKLECRRIFPKKTSRDYKQVQRSSGCAGSRG